MKWQDLRRSSNIEDFRARGGIGSSGGKMRLLVPIMRFLITNKYGRVILGIGIVAYFLGYNPLVLLSFLDPSMQQEKTVTNPTAKENETAEFVSVVLAQSEDVWHTLFKKEGLKIRFSYVLNWFLYLSMILV